MAHENNPVDKVVSELQNSSAHYHECVSDIPFYALRVEEWMNRLIPTGAKVHLKCTLNPLPQNVPDLEHQICQWTHKGSQED